ncbi:GNAT family N-acetyltransferase [Streptomyces sp. NPDC046915]|uniref:GNAT family N-acetyltransferase n=1 Tax=Streptomyces sp. NPDC046915 TaxID=3155257 RepID=UPI0033C50F89
MTGGDWELGVIRYTDDIADADESMLCGFFAGWPKPPSPAQHLAVLRGSFRAVLAIDDAAGCVIGFVTMISDGVLTAAIPWLEVLPGHRGQGIGSELMRRILEGTERFYSVDLLCDAPQQPYYARFGMAPVPGAALRHPEALRGGAVAGRHTRDAGR